ncbi:hypothetical protein [Dokdonella sp.]|uniref:hypothetical protein n=1 Tax=Dokdonella sp. TaxID=2291710 RepID=UPI001B0EED6B|nr:hypothetical protein [Dokdonella sp.]MBO9664063.1 hypothetical protein [Dokdonella sp.]
MSNDAQLEVYRALRTSQDKYAYFLLAAAGASIAFAITQTRGHHISWFQIPLGLAVLCWGFSFFFGCRNIAYVNSTLYANSELIRVQNGEHPEVGRNSQMQEAACAGIRAAIESKSSVANSLSKFQFYFLIAGAVLYICWHVLEMCRQ